MRLCLIWPGCSLTRNIDVLTDRELHRLMTAYYALARHKPFPSVGAALPLIAALTPPVFDEICIIDGNKESIPLDDKFDLVGISIMTAQANEGYSIAREFQKRGVYTVLGGIHATIMPHEAVRYADTVIIGEAEKTWPVFIRDFLSGRPRKVYRQTEAVDLARPVLPRHDLLPAQEPGSYAYIQTSRGCPNNCDYCSITQSYGPLYRYKSPAQVVDEVRAFRHLHPYSKIFFSDDNMFVDKNRAKRLLKAISPLNITWATQSDVSIAKEPELLELIRASGCEYLFVGLESITEQGIALLSKWKQKRFGDYCAAIRTIQSYGVPVLGAFIVGTDDHDETVFDKLIHFTREAGLTSNFISVLTPLPGTRIRQMLKEQNRLLKKSWSNYDFFGINYKPLKITPQSLQRGLLETMIYFRETANESNSVSGTIYQDERTVSGGRGV